MYDIDFIRERRGDIKLHVREFLLYPEFWNKDENKIVIKLKWKFVKFVETKKNLIPQKRGIYCFVVKPTCNNFFETRYLFYIGKTNRTLRERFSEYLRDQKGKGKPRLKVYEMLNYYKDNVYFYYAEITSVTDVNTCEDNLLNTFMPYINTQIPAAKINHELRYIY